MSVCQRRHRLLLSNSSSKPATVDQSPKQPFMFQSLRSVLFSRFLVLKKKDDNIEVFVLTALVEGKKKKRNCSVYCHKRKQTVFNLTANRKRAAKSPSRTFPSFSSQNSVSLAQPHYYRKHTTVLPLLLSCKLSSECLVSPGAVSSLPSVFHSPALPPFCSWNLFTFRNLKLSSEGRQCKNVHRAWKCDK